MYKKLALLGLLAVAGCKTSAGTDAPLANNAKVYNIYEGAPDWVQQGSGAFSGDRGKGFYGVGLVSHPVSQGVLDWTFVLAVMASPLATRACVDAFGTTDFRPDLPSFTMPTLIIHGTSDATVPIDAAGRAAARGIRQARLIEYDGEPHGLFATAPDRLSADLLTFLRT